MRGLMVAGAACLVLAGCSPETPPPVEQEEVVAGPMADNADPDAMPPPVDCTQINGVFAAFNEPTPFASLRSGAVQADGRFASAISPANATCTIGETPAAGAAAPSVHAMNCTLVSTPAPDRRTNAEPAKAAFLEARRQLDACLPADWTSRDGAAPDTDADEAMIYESQADAQRAMTGSSYTYPVQLKKAWVEDGAASRWRVTLDFQKEAGR